MARLAVPVIALGSEATHRLLLDETYRHSQAQIASTTPALPNEAASEAVGSGVIATAKRWLQETVDAGRNIADLKGHADRWIEHMLRLAAVFVVQTLLLPLLFLWLMLQLYRALTHPPEAARPVLTAGPRQ